MKILKCRNTKDNLSLIYELMNAIRYVPSDHQRHWISEFQHLLVPYPHPDEQRKIAEFLGALDDKIAAVGAQVDHMQTFKKGLLQKMFV